ncbi:hypothetical protein BH23PAT2_BH23PAT2_02970 [soil metagenome]
MINLLPPDVKKSIEFARYNTVLVRWLMALVVAIAGVFIIILIGHMHLTRTTDNITQNTEVIRNSLEEQNLEATQQEVQDISNSLNLIVQVLSRQVLFSDLIRQIGSIIPEGAVLTGLTINQTTGGIDLLADATDYNTATQVQVNLEDPENQIFKTADIINIRCEQSEDNAYPCQITIRALFGENSQFLLIPPTQSRASS